MCSHHGVLPHSPNVQRSESRHTRKLKRGASYFFLKGSEERSDEFLRNFDALKDEALGIVSG
jgi:hypothetical protein